jgi:hypothetical protein
VTAARPNNGPQLTWINVITTIAVILTMAGGGWLLMQNALVSENQQRRDSTAALLEQIRINDTAIARLRDSTIQTAEFLEFKKHVYDDIQLMRDQIKVMEATRPTTGELQTANNNSLSQISDLNERVRSLEDYLRTPRQLGPAAPVGR